MIALCPWLQRQHSCHFIWSFPDCVVRTVLLCVHMYCTLTVTIELHLKVVDIPTNNAATNKHTECSQIIVGRFYFILFFYSFYLILFHVIFFFLYFLSFFSIFLFCFVIFHYIISYCILIYFIWSCQSFILLFFFI